MSTDDAWARELAEAREALERARRRAGVAAPVADAPRASGAASSPPPEDDDDSAWLDAPRRAHEALAARRRAHGLSGCTRRPCELCGLAKCARCRREIDLDDMPGVVQLAVRAGEAVRTVCDACRPAEKREVLLAPARKSVSDYYRDVLFDTPKLSRGVLAGGGAALIARARKAVDEANVLFVGEADTGKTLLLAAMLHEVVRRAEVPSADRKTIDRGAGALWVEAIPLSVARAQHPLGREEDPPLIARAKAAAVLVIDDIGSELGVPGRQECAREVVFHRFGRGATTWISTGLGAQKLGDGYGGGFVRRIAGENGAYCIRMLARPEAVGDGR